MFVICRDVCGKNFGIIEKYIKQTYPRRKIEAFARPILIGNKVRSAYTLKYNLTEDEYNDVVDWMGRNIDQFVTY